MTGKEFAFKTANKVLCIASIPKGNISGTVTDVRIVLQFAIKADYGGVTLCRNRPGVNLQPGESDIAITMSFFV